MFRNLFKTAWRSLLKNKGFTFLNIAGLALGLSTFLLITFYVADELSYDRYNIYSNRIYRVNADVKFGGSSSSYAVTPPTLAGALTNTLPEVEKAARLISAPDFDVRFKKGNENFQENKVAYADESIFDIFTLPMIYGDPHHALTEPYSIVITERAAKKYFNKTDVVGQTLTLVRSNTLYKISGVIRDIPVQSHFSFDFFLSMVSFKPSLDNNWGNFSFSTYLLLRPGADAGKLEKRFPELLRGFMGAKNYDEFENNGSHIGLNLTPLTDIHLGSNRQYELGINNSKDNVYLFSAIAILVLLIACINFMNLSTARSTNRAREVGVRKVLGSSRRQLILQFLSESLLVTLFAVIIAVVMACVLLPFFNQMANKELAFSANTPGRLLILLSGLVIIVGGFAGSYPAFFLSGFKPIQVLKDNRGDRRLRTGKERGAKRLRSFLSAGLKAGNLRNLLVIFQFSISIFLIIGTLVIYNQLQYIQKKDLGFDRNQVLVIKNVHILDNAKILQQEIRQFPEVVNTSLSSFLPTGSLRSQGTLYPDASIDDKNAMFTELWPVDEGYLSTMGMKLAMGRNFSSRFVTDSSGIIINETAAKKLGYGADPLNRKLYISGDSSDKPAREYHVIGLLKDFNFSSLRDNITPVVMILGRSNGALSIRTHTGNLAPFVAKAERIWNALSPQQHFEYSFMDEDFNAAYRSEQRVGKLFLSFTILAIIIACLGLFGLAAYAAEQRNREIGIRKVLGASVTAITAMLSKDFIKLIIFSIFISTPIAWLAMQKWLQGFAYRAPLHWWIMGLAGCSAVLIAGITISFQSIKAALANPIESLRRDQ